MQYKTEQEEFWAGEFGDEYIQRNKSKEYLASNLNFFSRALKYVGRPKSVIEFGANIGMNLLALKQLYPDILLHGIEINEAAANILRTNIGQEKVSNCSFFDFETTDKYDLTLIKGVLIHVNPEMLDSTYQKLYETSSKFILICEYYNPAPVVIKYRGHDNRLFKRDFAGEILTQYSDLTLVDYGFVYKRDPAFPQDDITWFLLKKG